MCTESRRAVSRDGSAAPSTSGASVRGRRLRSASRSSLISAFEVGRAALLLEFESEAIGDALERRGPPGLAGLDPDEVQTVGRLDRCRPIDPVRGRRPRRRSGRRSCDRAPARDRRSRRWPRGKGSPRAIAIGRSRRPRARGVSRQRERLREERAPAAIVATQEDVYEGDTVGRTQRLALVAVGGLDLGVRRRWSSPSAIRAVSSSGRGCGGRRCRRGGAELHGAGEQVGRVFELRFALEKEHLLDSRVCTPPSRSSRPRATASR